MVSQKLEPLNQDELESSKVVLKKITSALQNVLFGQETLIELVIIGVLARGHLLLEGLPGLGKTELIKGLSKVFNLETKRIQFTPDLLPGDITGNPILQEVNGTRQFVFQPGPLFANFVLADEINRASPKTQSALLEAMQERRVTVLGQTHELPKPFFVLATQNPIDLEGTYSLPEAQLDRFLFKIEVYSNPASVLKRIVMNREIGEDVQIEACMQGQELEQLLERCRRVYLPESVADYIARLVEATHVKGTAGIAEGVRFGASPRAALALAAASKARALLQGRLNASFEDVKAVVLPVLRHRLILDHGSRMSGLTTEKVVQNLLVSVTAEKAELPDSLRAAKIS